MPLPDPAQVLKTARKRRRHLRKRARGLRRALPKYRKQARRTVYRQWNKRRRRTYAERLDTIPSRDELPALLNARGLLGTAVEIGVKTGKYSHFLLTEWRGQRLISIDPWLEDAPEAYVDTANVPQSEQERLYEQTRERLAQHGGRSEIWRTTSTEGAERVPDASLDFVYIDARHDYASVLEDLGAWFPKVRPGGILGGHDYATGHFRQGDFGVKQAVDEFFAERGIRVYATEGRPPAEMFASWLIEIPRASKGAGPANDQSSPSSSTNA